MEASDLELFEESLGSAVERHTGPDLDQALSDLGWHDALSVEPRAAIATLFSLQGHFVATSSTLSDVLDHALGLGLGLPVVLPRLGQSSSPGALEDDSVAVDGLGDRLAGEGQRVVVISHVGSEAVATMVAVGELTAIPVAGLDPDRGLVRLLGSSEVERIGPVYWEAGVRLARLAIGHELVGAARRMLELACEHALNRVQFDQPIASFQAVRHRLAETLVAVELAESALDAAWIDEASHHAAIAKSLAGRGARTASRHCQQVLAGIGFTLEHPFHRYMRRVLLLDELFGSAASITHELGTEVIRNGRLPSEILL